MAERNTVLVVEDDAPTREGLMGLLVSEGFDVLGAENGLQALELLAAAAAAAPSLIVLDLMMPVMDGWQFLAERRKAARGKSPPIVLLSGLGLISGAPGVADFLRKPIDPEVFLACVRRLCRERHPTPRRRT